MMMSRWSSGIGGAAATPSGRAISGQRTKNRNRLARRKG
jgi:hypothetical protein